MTYSGPAGSELAPPGLKDLEHVELNPRNRALLKSAVEHCGGDRATRNRKQSEARELLALSQIAPSDRLTVKALDLREHLRALLMLQVPVACRPRENNKPEVADGALIGFTYPSEGFRRPLPGYAFFQIMLPRDVWLAQIKQPEQALCIAPLVPAGTRTALLVLWAYGALSMQSIQIDVQDPAGLFDAEIARWWQDNLHLVPLTTTALLDSETPQIALNTQGMPWTP
jgi:hypothetical protein